MNEKVKLLGLKIGSNTKSFGLILNEDRVDCQVGVECQTLNGLFTITERRWDATKGELHLSFQQVQSNRKRRRQIKSVN